MPDLVPVDHDPWQTIPVDHDPFASDLPVPKSGQTIPPTNALAAASPNPAAGYLSGLSEAAKVPQMTEGEQQMFFLGALPALIGGPEAKVAEEAAPAVARGIRAFHGSPYDFDKFDLLKIGTGEGAQAYGAGLYFAENPLVAEDYKRTLALKSDMSGASRIDAEALKYIHEQGGIEQAKAALDAEIQKWGANSTAGQHLQAVKDAVRPPNPGKMYEVNINADPEHFLDWDKPLSEQPQNVQDAIKSTASYADRLAGHNAGRLKHPDEATGAQWLSFLRDEPDLRSGGAGDPGKSAGLRGFPAGGANEPFTTAYLRSQGIPGIKYLDQGSRGRPLSMLDPQIEKYQQRLATDESLLPHERDQIQGSLDDLLKERAAVAKQTRNYVVFNDKLIDIVKKYGLAGLVAGGAAHFSTQPVDHDPFQ